MAHFFNNMSTTVRQCIKFVAATLILLYAIGIFRAHLQIIVILIALFMMLKSFVNLGGMAKAAHLLGVKGKFAPKKGGKDGEDDIF